MTEVAGADGSSGLAGLPVAVQAFLATDRRIGRCPPDVDYARTVAEHVIADECEDALHAAGQGRWHKANTYSYDGARKSVEALLLAYGWRVRPVAGAHAAVVEVVDRWLGAGPNPGPRLARSFAAARKARHDDEYPSATSHPRTGRELRALTLDNVRVINASRAHLGLAPATDVLPTEASLDRRSRQARGV